MCRAQDLCSAHSCESTDPGTRDDDLQLSGLGLGASLDTLPTSIRKSYISKHVLATLRIDGSLTCSN